VYRSNPHNVQKLQAEIEVVAEEIIDYKSRDTGDNFVVRTQRVHVVKGSHAEHVFT
jgi:hypothetical protein